MAYSSTNPVRRLSDGAGLSDGFGVFVYRSTHTHSDIEAAGFFTDGKRHGLKLGDVLIAAHFSSDGSSAATMHVVSASTGAIAASATAGSSAYNQAYNVSVSAATT